MISSFRKYSVPAADLFLPFNILSRRIHSSNPGRIRSLQNKRLRRIVAHAAKKVPYYQRLFDRAGIDPSTIRSLEDLSKIPVTTKQDIRTYPVQDFLASGYKPGHLIAFKTSGATGIPLSVYQSRFESFVLHLIKLRALRALGLTWRDKMIKVRSRAHTYRPPVWMALQRLGLYRQEAIDSQAPELVVSALEGKRADVLTGYTGTLVRIAQIFAEKGGQTLRPRFLIGGSETMTPFIRSQIEEGFGAPIRDTYICQETGIAAWECPDSGLYHTVDDSLIIEVLKDGKPCRPGEEGEVVVTNLICRSMPFIRYRMEDLVTLSSSDCPCGRRTLSFDRILGKLQDYFWLPGEREFNPWDLSGLWMGRASWILQYELVQEKPDAIVMRLIPTGPPPSSEMDRLIEDSRKIIGEGVDFRVEIVSEIEPSEGGKFRVHRSLVRSIYDNPLDQNWFGQEKKPGNGVLHSK